MKSYTDLEESKKLAEILPSESADMGLYYSKNPNAARNQMWVGTKVENSDIPCWSLAALLEVIKPINENTYTIRGTLDGGATISFDEITNVMFQEEEIIDAVFEMVVWLKENGKL